MTDRDVIALIQADIDGELDVHQRAQLARTLLADPEARELREELLRVRAMLDSIEDVEPPGELKASVLNALPVPALAGQSRWPAARWRYAAGIVLVLGAAAVVYESVNGPGPASSELAGTMAARRTALTLDTVTVESAPVTGRVSLYRDSDGLGLSFELVSSTPVTVVVASEGQRIEVTGLAGTGSGNRVVPLAGPATGGRTVGLTFLVSGREVGRAVLSVPEGQ